MPISYVTEITGIQPNGIVEFRTTEINDGVKTYHRGAVCPGDDYSAQPDVVRNACADAHTPEVVLAYQLANATDYTSQKAAVLAQARELRDKIFDRLNGIQLDYVIAGSTPTGVAAIATAKVGLKDITTHATVVAAVTGAETTAALKARYAALVTPLYVADQYAVSAFNGLDV